MCVFLFVCVFLLLLLWGDMRHITTASTVMFSRNVSDGVISIVNNLQFQGRHAHLVNHMQSAGKGSIINERACIQC